MRIIATVIAGVLGYAVVLIVLNKGVGVVGASAWYWVPFVVSLCAVVAVAVPWRTWGSVNRTVTIAAACLLGVLVLVIDVGVGVWYACMTGDCL